MSAKDVAAALQIAADIGRVAGERDALAEQVNRLAADCANLTAELEGWRNLAEQNAAEVGRLCVERERLRAALEAAPEPTSRGDWLDWLIDLKDWFRTTRAEALRHE